MQKVKTAQIGGRRQASCVCIVWPGLRPPRQSTWVSTCDGHNAGGGLFGVVFVVVEVVRPSNVVDDHDGATSSSRHRPRHSRLPPPSRPTRTTRGGGDGDGDWASSHRPHPRRVVPRLPISTISTTSQETESRSYETSSAIARRDPSTSPQPHSRCRAILPHRRPCRRCCGASRSIRRRV
jgi:hypothetical protein